MMEGWKVGRSGAAGAALLGGALLSILPAFQPSASAQDTLPIGYGTLKRDDIVVKFATDQLQIHVLPLAQSVIRLLAPDTYASLEQLLKSRQAEIDLAAQRAGIARPTLVMVSFFGVVPQARFNPEDVNITSQGRLFRPVGIVPLSPRWSSYQLDAREQAIAIYVFEEGINFRETVGVSYQDATNDVWRTILPLLDRERSRVLARAGLDRSP